MNPKRALNDSIWTIADWLFPPVCVGCGEPGDPICKVCMKSIAKLPEKHCKLCGNPVTGTEICTACRNNQPAFNKFYASAIYSGLIRKAIHQLKYRRDLGMGRFLAKLIAKDLKDWCEGVDFVVPMPLSKQRMRSRGYNQSAIITAHLTELTGLAHVPQALHKIKDTESQVHLTVEERMANLEGAFEAERSLVAGKQVLILDDVFTTGATMRQATKALKVAGVSKIYAVTIAKTLWMFD